MTTTKDNTFHTLTAGKSKLFGAVLIQESSEGETFRVSIRDWRKLGMSDDGAAYFGSEDDAEHYARVTLGARV